MFFLNLHSVNPSAKKIKGSPVLNNTSIILYGTDEKIIEKHEDYYAKAHILKPFDIKEIVTILDRCIGNLEQSI